MELPTGGRVGLSAWRCGGVGFDKVSLHPTTITELDRLEELATGNKTKSLAGQAAVNTSAPITKAVFARLIATAPYRSSCHAPHILVRKAECEKLLGTEANSLALMQCQYNFCGACCSKSVSSFIQGTHANRNTPRTTFQWRILQEEMSSLQTRCLIVGISLLLVSRPFNLLRLLAGVCEEQSRSFDIFQPSSFSNKNVQL